jgi:hypothetical protein
MIQKKIPRAAAAASAHSRASTATIASAVRVADSYSDPDMYTAGKSTMTHPSTEIRTVARKDVWDALHRLELKFEIRLTKIEQTMKIGVGLLVVVQILLKLWEISHK